jgi:hypothetical protein
VVQYDLTLRFETIWTCFLARHSLAVSRNVEMFMEFPRKLGANVTRLVMTTAMQCTATMTTSRCWLQVVLFVLCLVDQCYGNLNLYLSQWEVRRLLGKSFWTRDVMYLTFHVWCHAVARHTGRNRRRDAAKSVNQIILIPQLDLFRHELWGFGTYYFSYREASFSVHFNIAILSSIFQISVRVQLNIFIVY